MLAFTDQGVLPFSTIYSAIKELGNAEMEKCDPQIITQVTSQSKFSLWLFFPLRFPLCDLHQLQILLPS